MLCPKGKLVADCAIFDMRDRSITPERNQANARLVAAAPELLAALHSAPVMSKYHGQHGFEAGRFILDYDAWRAQARAAIAKATGA